MRQIIFTRKRKLFIYTMKNQLYLMCIRNGHLGQLYFGKRLHDKADFSYLVEKCGRPMTSYIYEWDRTFHWNISDRNIQFTVRQTTDIRQLNCCRKMAAGSVSSNMTAMRLLPENRSSPDCRQLTQNPMRKRRHCASS